MTRVCLLQYGVLFLASLFGSGIGTFLVVRFWRTGELDLDERNPK